MDWIATPEAWIALATLTVLEIVLGIDNIIFISILSERLPPDRQRRARMVGLLLAMVARLGLLFSLSLIMKLTAPFFTLFGAAISGRDLILLIGGLFLIGKSTHEIHEKLEGEREHEGTVRAHASYGSIIGQILILDIVFSLDSVITAIGMADNIMIMVIAIVIAVGFMLLAAEWISDFVFRHPTIKMLALSFLLLIGVSLMAEGFDQSIPKGYIYFAMAFSVFVEMLNLRVRKRRQAPVVLRKSVMKTPGSLPSGK